MSHPLSLTTSAASSAAPALEILAFRLGAEEYAVDIQRVQELRGYDQITRIANAPAWLKGVINLRGTIVPIIDLRMRLTECSPDYDQFTVVIIVNVGTATAGAVVDGVSDVLRVDPAQMRPSPLQTRSVILGLCTVQERLLQLVDLDRLLDADAFAGTDLAAAVTLN